MTSPRADNLLLAALPEDDFRFLEQHLHSYALAHRAVLFAPGEAMKHVYFPCSGAVSLLADMRNDLPIECATVGRDGVLGASAAFMNRPAVSHALVQCAGDSVRVTATHFREMFAHSHCFRDLVFRFEETLFVRAQQAAACNTLHDVSARMCRWLLEAHDKSGSTTIPVTQELLAQLLGVQRTTITFVAKRLQRAGVISVRRGHVELFDLQQLRDAACECYAALRAHQETIFEEYSSARAHQAPRVLTSPQDEELAMAERMAGVRPRLGGRKAMWSHAAVAVER
jgi:CRP-like cAMP-binding protein